MGHEDSNMPGSGTQVPSEKPQSILGSLPFQVVVSGDEAVLWASQVYPLNHEEAAVVIAALQKFYARITPEEMKRWRYDLRMNIPTGLRRPQRGYVYLITDGDLSKIGITTRGVRERLRQLEQEHRRSLQVVWAVYSDDATGLEARLHRAFDGQRVTGEWFRLSEDDVAYITSLDGEA